MNTDRAHRFERETLLLFFKGMAMGAADSVPGVSGGTVALITNIYTELVDSIKSFGWKALIVWKNEGFKAAWQYINGSFLLTLFAGILTSLLLLGRIIIGLMENYLPYLMAFFAGLVIASIRFVAGNISIWKVPSVIAAFCLGVVLAVILAILPLADASNSPVYYFFCGAIAICAMILPGISGAFILVLLGAYAPVLEALTQFNFGVVGIFAAGCISGLMLFSRFLSWLLHHHHDGTMSALTGMLAGSLYLLWPWRLANEINMGDHIFTRYQHVLPDTYTLMTGSIFSPLICAGLLVLGIFLVLLLEFVAGNMTTESSNSEP
jgi:putative membrane protein